MTAVSTIDAFHRAIRAHPEDDGPRLMFADWLDEHGQTARAEFIRVQCALAAGAERLEHQRLRNREQELLEEHESAWIGLTAEALHDWQFRRGFVEAVALDARSFLELGPRLFAVGIVRRLRLTHAGRYMPTLAVTKALRDVQALEISGSGIGPDGLVTLASSPYLVHLELLDISENGVGDAGVRALSRSRHLPRLRELNLRNNGVTDVGLAHLVRATHLSKLCRLNLSANAVTCDGLAHLANSALGRKVTCLDLTDNYIGCRGINELVRAERPALRSLRLARNQIAGDGAAALARSPLLAQLTALDLEHNSRPTGFGWSLLRASPHWDRLRASA